MMQDPVIIHSTYFKCPRCNCSFVTIDRYREHAARCNDEVEAEARALVGTWAAVIHKDYSIFGKVVGTDAANVRIKGIRLVPSKRGLEMFAYDDWVCDYTLVENAVDGRNTRALLACEAEAMAETLFDSVFDLDAEVEE